MKYVRKSENYNFMCVFLRKTVLAKQIEIFSFILSKDMKDSAHTFSDASF
jgi:hypothetical protein